MHNHLLKSPFVSTIKLQTPEFWMGHSQTNTCLCATNCEAIVFGALTLETGG